MSRTITSLSHPVKALLGSAGASSHRPFTKRIMQVSQLNVLVVGAATGGSAVALLLARAGARVTVVERVAKHSAVGAGIALAANGRAVLESLGLGPALAIGKETPGLRITDGCGRTIASPPKGARLSVITRAHLHETLTDALLAEPGIVCRFGTELLSTQRDGTVTLAHNGAVTVEKYDLVIGADGVNSVTRNSGKFGAQVRRTGIRYLRALVPFRVHDGTEAWTSSGLFGAIPLGSGAYIYASCASPALAKAIENRDLEALHTAWGAVHERASWLLMGVSSFDDLLIHEVVRVDCDRWNDGNLVLMGDAAHAMAPNLGQGANSALVDAAVLMDSLRTSVDLESALVAYSNRRRGKVRAVADTAERLGKLAELSHPILRALRDRLVMPLASLFPAERQLRGLLQEPPELLMKIGRA
jgi:2-polyprenyl-6-methoxyphenol hydroxylase-like FAD-dependent oxidoreductase